MTNEQALELIETVEEMYRHLDYAWSMIRTVHGADLGPQKRDQERVQKRLKTLKSQV